MSDSPVPRSQVSIPKPSFLIVDDESVIADTLALILVAHGYPCTTAYDGDEAIAKARWLQPRFILMNVSMPRMVGTDAAAIILDEQPHCMIMFFSGSAKSSDLTVLRQRGYDPELLPKPLHPQTLMSRLRELGFQPDPVVQVNTSAGYQRCFAFLGFHTDSESESLNGPGVSYLWEAEQGTPSAVCIGYPSELIKRRYDCEHIRFACNPAVSGLPTRLKLIMIGSYFFSGEQAEAESLGICLLRKSVLYEAAYAVSKSPDGEQLAPALRKSLLNTSGEWTLASQVMSLPE